MNLLACTTDIFIVIISWYLAFIACCGFGSILYNFFKLKLDKEDTCFASCWLGWSFIIVFLSFYHLFLPINKTISIILLILGFIFFMKSNIKLKDIYLKHKITLIFFIFIVAFLAIQVPFCYDMGFYHLNTIRWLNEYSIVPGIGNLHFRLGFNQLFFVWPAVLNFHPYFNDYAFHISNSFLFALIGFQLLCNKKTFSKLLFALMVFMPVPFFWISSCSPDIASFTLQLCIFYFFTSFVRDKEKSKYSVSYTSLVAIIACISAFIKLNNALFALGLGLSAWIFHKFSINNDTVKSDCCLWKRVIIFIIFIILIWITRGYLSTGYPLFPSNIGKINFDWTLPDELTYYVTKCIKNFAKLGYYDFNSPLLNGLKWVPNWFYYLLQNPFGQISVYLILLSLYCFINWLIFVTKNKLKKENYVYITTWIIELFSIVFWFTQAPDIRFAGGLFIIFAVTGILLLVSENINIKFSKYIYKSLFIFPILCYLIIIMFYMNEKTFFIMGMLKLPKVTMKEMITDSGLKLYVPIVGDQSWDSKLPSTPEFKKNLTLRGKNIQSGFKILSTRNNSSN